MTEDDMNFTATRSRSIQRNSTAALRGVVTTVALLGLAATGAANAQDYSVRTDTWEFTLAIPYIDSKSVDVDGGTNIDFNSDVGLGFGIGYNFDPHLALGLDIAWNSPSYEGDVKLDSDQNGVSDGTERRTGEVDTSSWQLNLRYNFKPGDITPYISGGIGWTFVDSNIASGPPGASCWWDPWYGYICYGYQPTYSDWRFSYNTAVGVRWNLNQKVFMRAGIGMYWLDTESGGSEDFTTGRIEVGFTM